jgi:NADH-quinone oxidoreductase subunit C
MLVSQEVVENLEEIRNAIEIAHGERIRSSQIVFGELTLVAGRDGLLELLRYLRDDSKMQFWCLIDICGVDFPEREQRFEVVYHLLSPRQNLRVRIKVATDEKTPLPSATPIWPGADWFERECWDMYGVLFTGHPDLRRILTDYGFTGHPQRRDFPLTGYTEVRYDNELKRVVYEPVELRQEYRHFDFLSPWEGPDYPLPNETKGDEKARS